MHVFFVGNLVGQIVERMQNKTKNETLDFLIPGTNLVLYSGVSSMYTSAHLCVMLNKNILGVNKYETKQKQHSDWVYTVDDHNV